MLFDSFYEVREDDREPFGDRWCGPEKFDHKVRDWVKVAEYEKDPLDGDGQRVIVEMIALPARFYRVTAEAGVNSCNEPNFQFILDTGSGYEMGKWAAQTALFISQGMIGLPRKED